VSRQKTKCVVSNKLVCSFFVPIIVQICHASVKSAGVW